MRTIIAGLALAGAFAVASLTAVTPAQASKIRRITTIIPLTDDMVKHYIACVDVVDRAESVARGAIPGQSYGAARKRDRAARTARRGAFTACGMPNDFPWGVVRHSVNSAVRNCCATGVYVSDSETTRKGIARVQAANRALLAKYPRATQGIGR